MQKKEGKKWKRLLLKWGVGIALPILLIGVLYGLQSVFMHHPSIGEAYVRGPFRVISFLPRKISSLIPVSITEIVVVSLVLAAPFLIAWLIIRIVRAVKEKRGKAFFYKRGRDLAWILFAIYFVFMLLHGFNFTRYTLEENMHFGQKNYSIEELQEVYAWVVTSLNEARSQCQEDENGVLSYPGGYPAFLKDMQNLYEDSAEKIDPILENAGRPKPVALSHYWSYTYIVGMYFPFFAEPNINIDVPFPDIVMNTCHEMSHLHGMAVENDANLAAMLIGINSASPELRYAGFCQALDLIDSDLSEAYNDDRDGYRDFIQNYEICDGYFRDYNACADYWLTLDPPEVVTTVANDVNDTFLVINQQDEGVYSYQMPTSNVADYYYSHVKK